MIVFVCLFSISAATSSNRRIEISLDVNNEEDSDDDNDRQSMTVEEGQ